MAEFIEDPEIARTIDDLKRRYPAIGNAADHPLVEFFIHRQKMKPRRLDVAEKLWQWVWVIVVLAYLASMKFSPLFAHLCARYNWVLMLIVFFGIAFHRKYRTPPRRNDLRDSFQMISDAGDVSQWEHLWLAPLTCRDLVGASLGIHYHRKTSSRSRPWRLILRIFLWLGAAALVATYFMDQIRFMKLVTCYGYPLETAAILGGLVFLIFSVHGLFTNINYSLHRTMTRIENIILRRQRRIFVVHEFWKHHWKYGFGTMAFVIALQINFFSVAVFASRSWGWMYIAGSLVGWGLVAQTIRLWYARMNISAKFDEFIAREESQYHLLVCHMIGR